MGEEKLSLSSEKIDKIKKLKFPETKAKSNSMLAFLRMVQQTSCKTLRIVSSFKAIEQARSKVQAYARAFQSNGRGAGAFA